MTDFTSPSTDRLASVRRYRRLMGACLVFGVVGFFAAVNVDRPLVGVGVYWTGFLAFLAIWRGTSLELFDERERALERTASTITLTLFAFVLIVGGPGLKALSVTETYTAPQELQGALYGYAVQFGVFGVTYIVLRYRR